MWGFGQYAVVKGRGADTAEVTWHATVAYMGLGTISLGLVVLFGGRLTPFLDAPNAAAYVPGMALALYIRRLGAMPERVLTRRMEFRASGMASVVGEVTYTVVALTFAAFHQGGWSIVIANLVQSIIVVAILVRGAGIASWATPSKLRWARVKDMLAFGLPLGVQGIAHSASRYWDNLAISHFFGPGKTGAYNMAYNLADIPAIQVGEQIALVLMPSMAELSPERRPRALGIVLLQPYGVRLASCAVGLAFGTTAVAGVLLVMREGPSPRRLLAGFLQPLAACSVMIAAVWGVRDALKSADLDHPVVLFFAMVVTGAVVYVVAALALCRTTALDVIDLMKKALRRPTAD